MPVLRHLSYVFLSSFLKDRKVPNIKTAVIIAVLILVVTSNVVDFVMDFTNHAPTWHLTEEIIVAFGLIIYLGMELKQKKREMQALVEELKTTECSLIQSATLIKNARKEYSEIIHQHFVTPKKKRFANKHHKYIRKLM